MEEIILVPVDENDTSDNAEVMPLTSAEHIIHKLRNHIKVSTLMTDDETLQMVQGVRITKLSELMENGLPKTEDEINLLRALLNDTEKQIQVNRKLGIEDRKAASDNEIALAMVGFITGGTVRSSKMENTDVIIDHESLTTPQFEGEEILDDIVLTEKETSSDGSVMSYDTLMDLVDGRKNK